MDNDITLLETKFCINHIYRSKAIARKRLFNLLDDSISGKVTFINAPAGYGKTTLLSSWLTMRKKRSIKAAWLTLDEEDNDEVQFFLYFASAIQKAMPGTGDKAIKLMKASSTGSMKPAVIVLINEIQEVKKKFIFIIEDLHLIKNEEILLELKFFINHIPDNIHIIITGRRDMAKVLTGIKLSQEIRYIGQKELSFTREETADFINEIMDMKVSEENIKGFYELTEGWPAGLQILALSCRNIGIDAVLKDGSLLEQRQFSSYFIDDTMRNLPKNIQEFIEKTILLDTFTCNLCEYVTGETGCENILNELLDMNLFISCFDGAENSYRYHSLFSDFMRERIKKREPRLAEDIYFKAGQWYENAGCIQEACSYYIKGKGYERAVSIIERLSMKAIYSGRFMMLKKWTDQLPPDLIFKSIRMLLDKAWINLSKYNIEDARYYIEIIDESLKESTEPLDKDLEGEIFIAKAFVQMDDLKKSIDLLNRAMVLMENYNPNYSAALMSIATSYIIHGEIYEAEEYFKKALVSSRNIENLYSAAYSWGSLGMILTCQGRLKEAEGIFDEAEKYLVEKGGKSIPFLGVVYSGLSDVFYMRNQIHKALEYSSIAIDMFERSGLFDIKYNCYVVKARALLAIGNKEAATQTMETAIKLAEKDKVYGFKRHIEYCRASMYMDMGDISKAEEFSARYNISCYKSIMRYNLHDYILFAELLVKSERYEEGIECIQNILKSGSIGRFYEVHLGILMADALLSFSDTKAAWENLDTALNESLEENYIRLFLDYGERMKDMLKEFIESSGRDVSYAEQIIRFFETESIKETKNESLLTAREMEVLELIAKGAANDEIAKNLFISLSTVKSHVLNICGKLGVKSRTKAVAEAEKKGILHL